MWSPVFVGTKKVGTVVSQMYNVFIDILLTSELAGLACELHVKGSCLHCVSMSCSLLLLVFVQNATEFLWF